MTDPTLLTTPLYAWHAANHARLVEFAGWRMPLQYGSIIDEHMATRRAAGLFDISHMGRLRLHGPDAAAWLERVLTRRVADLRPGRIRYALVTNEQGGVLDDVLAYRLAQPHQGAEYWLVVNAANREKIVAWLETHRGGLDGELADATRQTAMIAVQGPLACELLEPLVDAELSRLKYYASVAARVGGEPWLVSRTGYTGEDGFELIGPAEAAAPVWTALVEAGRGRGARPAGLGARDTLRLEAAMPLYGHELNERITPIQAGLAFAVDLEDRSFVGRDALLAARDNPRLPRRVGLALAGRRIARQGAPIWDDGRAAGEVTSGAWSPTLGRPIAMGYVAPETASPGRRVEVEIRGKRQAAEIVPLPFYRRRSTS